MSDKFTCCSIQKLLNWILAEEKGVPLPQIALAFILQSPLNVFPLIGARTREEFAENVKAQGQPAVDGYLQMLQGGCAEPPLDLLRKAGVDLTRPDAIEAALQRFDRTVTELAELLEVGN